MPTLVGLPASDYSFPNADTQMGFDSLTIPYNPSGDPTTSMRDYYEKWWKVVEPRL